MKQNCTNNFIFLLSLVVILFFKLNLVSQSNNEGLIKNTIDSTKAIFGASDLLVNGPLYFQANRQANGSPYLINEEFKQGTVFTDESEYHNSLLNYDISIQKLLLLITTSNDSRVIISLSDVLIDSFMFSGYFFVNPAKIGLVSNYKYLHKINNGKHTMYIGYRKDFINRFNNTNPYGKFSSPKRSVFVANNGRMNHIVNKKALLKLFPNISKELVVFIRKNKIKLKKTSPEQLAILMEFINNSYEK